MRSSGRVVRWVGGFAVLLLTVSLVQAVEFVTVSDPAAADPVLPSSITLATDKSEFSAGDSAHLTATTDVTVSGTGVSIQILDADSEDVLETCSSGTTCSVDVQFFTGGAREYVARAGTVESDPVSVSREAWTLSVTSTASQLSAGQSATVTATANQDVGDTDGEYALFIFNAMTGDRVAACTSGAVCSVSSGDFYHDDSHYKPFVALVAAANDPDSLSEATDIQTGGMTTLIRKDWTLELTASSTSVVAGDVIALTATADQSVGATHGMYAIYVMNMYDGRVLKKCTTGSTCSVNFTWTGADRGISLYAFIAPTDVTSQEDLHDVQQAASVPVEFAAWANTISADKSVIEAGESAHITASTNQDVGGSGGELALYIIEWASDTIVKICPTGTTCEADDEFYKSTDQPFTDHVYGAVVASYNPDAVTYRDLDEWYATSDTVRVEYERWQIEVQQIGGSASSPRFMLQLNQDLAGTDGRLAVHLNGYAGAFAEETHLDSCYTGTRCLMSGTGGPGAFLFVIADAAAAGLPWDEMGGLYASALIYTGSPAGPTLPNEAIGGGNPAEKGCQCGQADPVNTATGEFYDSFTDLAIPGVGPSLQVSRSYSTARVDVAGPFGYGWSADLGMRVSVTIPGTAGDPLPRQVAVVQENGSQVLFTRVDADRYVALERVKATLEYDDVTGGWVFVRDLTQTFTFNASGELTSLADVNGNELGFTHTAGHIHTITAPGGRTISLTWVDDRITAATDSAGRSVSYGYDTVGDLTQVTAVDGAVIGYTYDSAHRVLTVTNPIGGIVTNTYDSLGRVLTQTDEVGGVTTFAYTTAPGAAVTDVTHPGGQVVRDEYQDGILVAQTRGYGTVSAARTEYQYDHALNLIGVTNPAGELTTSTFDDNGRRLTQTDPLGRVTTWTYDSLGNVTSVTDPAGAETVYGYDTHGNLTGTESAGGATETFTYNADGTVDTHEDALGNETVFTYTLEGWLESTTDPVGSVSSLGYDPAGFVTSTIDPGGATTTLTVDAAGRTLTTTDALSHLTSYGYDAAGNLTSTTDPTGAETTAVYDGASRRTSVTDDTGATTSYGYTSAGLLGTVTAPGGAVTTHSYDILGRLTGTTDPVGRTTHYDYDAAGRQTSTELPSSATSSIVYDDAGQPVTATNAMGEDTVAVYDLAGRVISTTDPLGRETTTSYTDDGHVDTVTLPDASTQHYDYDATGNVTSFTDADGNTTTYSYDDAGRLTTESRPGALVTSYSYDTAGHLAVKTLPDGSTLSYSYDTVGQLTTIDPSLTGAPDTSYSYDAAGRRASMTDETGTTSYSYDTLGRLTQVTDGSGDTVGYSYDARNNLTELEYPGGDTVTYSYDAADQMTSLTDWNTATTTYAWAADGLLDTRTDPNGIDYTVDYDDDGRTTDITAATTSSTVLLDIGYTYDDAGQLVTRDVDGTAAITDTDSYTYDLLGQLATRSTGGTFTATPAGALNGTADGATLSYNTAQQVTTLTPATGPTTSYSYDDNGARSTATTAGTTTSYSYNALGALTQVDLPADTIDYTADGDNLRQTRTDSTGTRNFTWDVNTSLPRLLGDDNHRYIYGPGIIPIAQDDGTSTEYLYGDLLGTTLLITDNTATPTGAYAYTEYGTVTTHTGTTTTEIGYTGNWTDTTTGLTYLRARDYDSSSSQFLAIDPEVAHTQHAYSYASNRPLFAMDPSGLATCGGDSDVGCNILMNLAAIGVGIGEALTFSPLALPFGETSLTAVARNALGGREAGQELQENGFYVFGSFWGGAAAGALPAGVAASGTSIAANSIRYSQSSVNGAARIAESMSTSGWLGAPIDVVRMADGALTAMDNTRLLAAQLARIDVKAVVHGCDEVIRAGSGLRPGSNASTWGEAVLERIASQNAPFRSRHPFGSFITGWIGN